MLGRSDRFLFSKLRDSPRETSSRLGRSDRFLFSKLHSSDLATGSRLGRSDRFLFSKLSVNPSLPGLELGRSDRFLFSKLCLSSGAPLPSPFPGAPLRLKKRDLAGRFFGLARFFALKYLHSAELEGGELDESYFSFGRKF